MRSTLLTLLLCSLAGLTLPAQSVIVNGVPWHDEEGRPVSAHGAGMIYEDGRYWLFGEYKTDSANVFTGISCYSSADLMHWRFERIALGPQADGRLAPHRVGERPKVLRCPATGEYVMLLHSDTLGYRDPCVVYATSPSVGGEYTYRGPLLYRGQPIRRWDIGAFTDTDGQAYLLVHHGYIYRLSEDFHAADSCLVSGLSGVGESPAMFRQDSLYYWLSSHTTSWERNDNLYFTAPALGGPWTLRGEFAPKGSLTWNSQTSFVMPLHVAGRTVPMYMGDRWSFPRQRSAATYVWLPMRAEGTRLSIDEYWPCWNPTTAEPTRLAMRDVAGPWTGTQPGEATTVTFAGSRVAISGRTHDRGGYADLQIRDAEGRTVAETSIDFYSLVPSEGLRYVSPLLPEGSYSLTIRVAEMRSNWSDKRGNTYGSKGHEVQVTAVAVM